MWPSSGQDRTGCRWPRTCVRPALSYRHFGVPMRLWRGAMPKGMYLKSQGFASNLSDPKGTHTLEAFCQATGHPYRSYGLPGVAGHLRQLRPVVPVRTRPEGRRGPGHRHGPARRRLRAHAGQRRAVRGPQGRRGHRRRALRLRARHRSPELPASACTHSSAHTDLAAFRGQEVVVVGAGQSALESAALLHENGATVQVLARKARHRLERPAPGPGPAAAASGSGSRSPGSARAGPPGSTPTTRSCSGACRERTRVYRARTALGPAGACWLRQRVEGQFPVRTGQTVTSAKVLDGKVRLQVAGAGTPAR